MKTCLVLGANGFVGSHLVDGLASKGFKVKAFDRFSSGKVQFIENERIEVVKGDINDVRLISSSMNNVDYLFHCFSATTPLTAEGDPYSDITDNLLHAVRIFEHAVDKKVEKVIFMSSGGAVYGTASEKGEVNEDTSPEPVSPYGVCKLAIEHYLAYYKRKHGLHYTVYRLTNPYGPRQITKHGQGVIPTFINNIQNQVPLTMYGDGHSSRDYIYISDAINMILKSFQENEKHETYNIGSGVQTSLNEIVDVIEKQAQKNAIIEHFNTPSTFLDRTPVSIQRFENDFGVYDSIDIIAGISDTMMPKYSR